MHPKDQDGIADREYPVQSDLGLFSLLRPICPNSGQSLEVLQCKEFLKKIGLTL